MGPGYWSAHSSHDGALLGPWSAAMLVQGSILLKKDAKHLVRVLLLLPW